MKIKIRYSFILYIIILYLFNFLSYFSIFFISILLHEIIHGIFGIFFKLKISSAEISFSGLNIEFERFNLNLSKKIIVLISGPIINLLIAIITYIMFKEKYQFIIITNLLLFIFNMMPIYPLDGGRILYEMLLHYYNFSVTRKILLIVYEIFTIVFLCIISYLYVNFYNIQIMFLGAYILSFCKYNNKKI